MESRVVHGVDLGTAVQIHSLVTIRKQGNGRVNVMDYPQATRHTLTLNPNP